MEENMKLISERCGVSERLHYRSNMMRKLKMKQEIKKK
jgi:hypothetical protein